MRIEGKVALVTGGGSGLGRATAIKIVSDGGKVVIFDRDGDKGQAVAAELGESATCVAGDVTVEADVQRAVEAATSFGEFRASVNCAGIGWAQRTINRQGVPHGLDPFKLVIDVNLIGTFNVLRLSASALSTIEPDDTGERGVIINTASIAAYDGQIGQIAYAASKGGIVGMTLPAARDLSKAGIRVVTIAPGLFDTPLLAMLPQAARDALVTNIPFPHRLGDPAEYAALVGSIVANSYLNGETVRLDAALRMAPK